MIKKITLLMIFVFTTSCVESNTAMAYAQRAHPECDRFQVVNHSYNGENGKSLTEVAMMCNDKRRSITIKCSFGWGIFNDTTCYENN